MSDPLEEENATMRELISALREEDLGVTELRARLQLVQTAFETMDTAETATVPLLSPVFLALLGRTHAMLDAPLKVEESPDSRDHALLLAQTLLHAMYTTCTVQGCSLFSREVEAEDLPSLCGAVCTVLPLLVEANANSSVRDALLIIGNILHKTGTGGPVGGAIQTVLCTENQQRNLQLVARLMGNDTKVLDNLCYTIAQLAPGCGNVLNSSGLTRALVAAVNVNAGTVRTRSNPSFLEAASNMFCKLCEDACGRGSRLDELVALGVVRQLPVLLRQAVAVLLDDTSLLRPLPHRMKSLPAAVRPTAVIPLPPWAHLRPFLQRTVLAPIQPSEAGSSPARARNHRRARSVPPALVAQQKAQSKQAGVAVLRAIHHCLRAVMAVALRRPRAKEGATHARDRVASKKAVDELVAAGTLGQLTLLLDKASQRRELVHAALGAAAHMFCGLAGSFNSLGGWLQGELTRSVRAMVKTIRVHASVMPIHLPFLNSVCELCRVVEGEEEEECTLRVVLLHQTLPVVCTSAAVFVKRSLSATGLAVRTLHALLKLNPQHLHALVPQLPPLVVLLLTELNAGHGFQSRHYASVTCSPAETPRNRLPSRGESPTPSPGGASPGNAPHFPLATLPSLRGIFSGEPRKQGRRKRSLQLPTSPGRVDLNTSTTSITSSVLSPRRLSTPMSGRSVPRTRSPRAVSRRTEAVFYPRPLTPPPNTPVKPSRSALRISLNMAQDAKTPKRCRSPLSARLALAPHSEERKRGGSPRSASFRDTPHSPSPARRKPSEVAGWRSRSNAVLYSALELATRVVNAAKRSSELAVATTECGLVRHCYEVIQVHTMEEALIVPALDIMNTLLSLPLVFTPSAQTETRIAQRVSTVVEDVCELLCGYQLSSLRRGADSPPPDQSRMEPLSPQTPNDPRVRASTMPPLHIGNEAVETKTASPRRPGKNHKSVLSVVLAASNLKYTALDTLHSSSERKDWFATMRPSGARALQQQLDEELRAGRRQQVERMHSLHLARAVATFVVALLKGLSCALRVARAPSGDAFPPTPHAAVRSAVEDALYPPSPLRLDSALAGQSVLFAADIMLAAVNLARSVPLPTVEEESEGDPQLNALAVAPFRMGKGLNEQAQRFRKECEEEQKAIEAIKLDALAATEVLGSVQMTGNASAVLQNLRRAVTYFKTRVRVQVSGQWKEWLERKYEDVEGTDPSSRVPSPFPERTIQMATMRLAEPPAFRPIFTPPSLDVPLKPERLPALLDVHESMVNTAPLSSWAQAKRARAAALKYVAGGIDFPLACSTSLEERWEDVLDDLKEDSCLHLQPKAVLLLLEGVPASVRARVWLELSGGAQERSRFAREYYRELGNTCEELGSQLPWREDIQKDVHRTLPKEPPLDSKEGRASLARVLAAYCIRNPETVGYCQSMNLLCGLLLTVQEEQDAFWTLSALVESRLGYYSQSMCAIKVDQRVLDDLVAFFLPEVHDHLARLDVTVSGCTVSWFLCLFVENPMKPQLARRAWDYLLMFGDALLFLLPLHFLAARREELLALNSTEAALNFLLHGALTHIDEASFGEVLRGLVQGCPPGAVHHFVSLQALCKHISQLRELHKGAVLTNARRLDSATAETYARQLRVPEEDVQRAWVSFLSPAPWRVLLGARLPDVLCFQQAFCVHAFPAWHRAFWRDEGLFCGVLKRLFDVLDVRGTGALTLDEFLYGLVLFTNGDRHERTALAFRFFDWSGRGEVSRSDLARTFTMFRELYGGQATGEEARRERNRESFQLADLLLDAAAVVHIPTEQSAPRAMLSLDLFARVALIHPLTALFFGLRDDGMQPLEQHFQRFAQASHPSLL